MKIGWLGFVLVACTPPTAPAPAVMVKQPGLLNVRGAIDGRGFEAKWATEKKENGSQRIEIYDYAAGCAATKPFASAESGARRITLRVELSAWSAGAKFTLPNAKISASLSERKGSGVAETTISAGEVEIERTWSPGPLHGNSQWARVRVTLGDEPNRVVGEADLEECDRDGSGGMDMGD